MARSSSRRHPDPQPAPRAGGWILAACATFVIGFSFGVIAWMPAAALSVAIPSGLHCERWSGRLWRGECASFLWNEATVGRVVWDWRLRSLAQRRLVGSLLWQHADSWLHTDASLERSRVLRLAPLQGTLSLGTLRTIVGPRAGAPAGNLRLDGRVELVMETLEIRLPNDSATLQGPATLLRLRGAVIARELRWVGASTELGGFVVRWTDKSGGVAPFSTPLTPLDSPMDVGGDIEFPAAQGYRLRAVGRDASGRSLPFELVGQW